MDKLRRIALALWRHHGRHAAYDRGASAVEYGLMVAAIAALVVGVIFGLGGMVRSAFEKTCSTISAQLPAEGTCGAPAVVAPPAEQPTE